MARAQRRDLCAAMIVVPDPEKASSTMSPRREQSLIASITSAVYSELKNLCVWNKNNGGMGSLYRSKHELVFVYKAGTAPHRRTAIGLFLRQIDKVLLAETAI